MANQLFTMLGGNKSYDMNGFLQRLNQFQQNFTGDPKQQVQQLLNSGRMTQAQYNHLSQMATQIQNMLAKN